MKHIAPHVVFVAAIVGPIGLFWGQSGSVGPRFVAFWCTLLGVTDPTEIHIATGTAAAIALAAAVYFVWSLVLAVIAAADEL
jgi:hypothetical protein